MSARDFTIDSSDFRRAAAALSEAGYARAVGPIAAGALKQAGNAARRAIRAAMRPHRKTGKMAGKVRNWIDGRGIDTVVKVKAGGTVVHLITNGTAPHRLAPIRRQAMTVYGPGRRGAIVALATAVEHPGTKPDPVVSRGIDAAAGEISTIIAAAADGMVAALADRIGPA